MTCSPLCNLRLVAFPKLTPPLPIHISGKGFLHMRILCSERGQRHAIPSSRIFGACKCPLGSVLWEIYCTVNKDSTTTPSSKHHCLKKVSGWLSRSKKDTSSCHSHQHSRDTKSDTRIISSEVGVRTKVKEMSRRQKHCKACRHLFQPH